MHINELTSNVCRKHSTKTAKTTTKTIAIDDCNADRGDDGDDDNDRSLATTIKLISTWASGPEACRGGESVGV